ncbi:MAG: molecular chaperone HtpG [Alphaproteobacteria bacterium]|nr:molecular chaperone HtpG [Alphaproteobacteria bacterium]
MTETKAGERHVFQAEVSRLLDIVAHSLYSDRRVFLRELVSNAADACDRLRYEALQKPELTADDSELRITLAPDKDGRRLTISDNGIGMSRDELVSHLGTIARSGTAAFVKGLTGDSAKDFALIGQFGVGFYASFMVADRVEVVSRRAGGEEAWRWTSDGRGEFAVEPASRDRRGTDVILHLKEDAAEFAQDDSLRAIVRDYADHIAVPVMLAGAKPETLNQASALWTRARSEITEQQYAEFYRHLSHRFDEPWATIHWRAEGRIEYTGLLFVPGEAPFDLYHPDRKHGVKLYVRRVFITDKAEELLPRWLRFVSGVVDSADLPLNVSREMLQNNPVVRLMRQGLVGKLLAELEKRAKDDGYAGFWSKFGPVVKEGIVQDAEHRDRLLALCRFASTGGDAPTSLADYVGRMKEGQEAIYYVTGEDPAAMRRLPQLEGYVKRGVEVLLLADAVDDFWLTHVREFQGKPLRSVTRGSDDLAKIKGVDEKPDEAPPAGEFDALIALLKLGLENDVKDVRLSQRLEDSAVCLVADERDLDIHLERLLRQHKQLDAGAKRILEINPRHPVIRALAAAAGKEGGGDKVTEAGRVLVDQARLAAGDPIPDPAAFARRLETVLLRGLG